MNKARSTSVLKNPLVWVAVLSLLTMLLFGWLAWVGAMSHLNISAQCEQRSRSYGLGGPCLQSLPDYLVAHTMGDVNDSPVESLFFAGLVIVITVLAFLVHFVGAETQRENQEAARQGKSASFPHDIPWMKFIRKAFRPPELGVAIFWGIPAFFFFLAMVAHGHQDAAVFVMALAGIFVAAEHYASLRGQSTTLSAQREALGEQKSTLAEQKLALNDQKTTLGAQKETLDKQETLTRRLEENVKDIASALGKRNALPEMYQAYSRPSGAGGQSLPFEPGDSEQDATGAVYAVYREFDVDERWWSSSAWRDYLEVDDPPNEPPQTLFDALRRGNRRRIVVVVPYSVFGRGTQTPDRKRREFEAIFGLIWFYVVIWHVAQALDADKCDHRIVMAETPLWVHVVDQDLYQVFRAGGELMVQPLSRRGPQEIPLGQWARRAIAELALRGSTAEEYICTKLGSALPDLLNGSCDLDQHYGTILRKLHMDIWLDVKCQDQTVRQRQAMEEKCVSLLRDFVQILDLRQRGTVTPKLVEDYHGRSGTLAREVQ
jgi:hypothetical protein